MKIEEKIRYIAEHNGLEKAQISEEINRKLDRQISRIREKE